MIVARRSDISTVGIVGIYARPTPQGRAGLNRCLCPPGDVRARGDGLTRVTRRRTGSASKALGERRNYPQVLPTNLDKVLYFDILQIVKSIAPLPLARLEANESHVEAFKALAHLTRLQVFFFLVRAGSEMSVGEIQGAVGIPGPTLSHHLDLLRRAGLVESRREERYVYYSVRREAVTTLVRLLTACC
jgi:DNA-binding transcriptional ArsR family regulator